MPTLDETGSDKLSEWRKFGYHLRGITPRVLNIRGKRISSIAIMSTRGIPFTKGILMVTFLVIETLYLSYSHLMAPIQGL